MPVEHEKDDDKDEHEKGEKHDKHSQNSLILPYETVAKDNKPILIAATGSLTGLLNAPKTSDVLYFYHTDHLGTPILMTDSKGNKVWEAEYMPFGEPVSISGIVENNLRFPGQYFDAETGLHQNGYRDYKAGIGRYISEDPIGFEGGDVNLYVYVGNNPVNFVDPLGLKCKKPFWSRVGENFWQTNKVIPGILAPTGLGLLTSTKTAEAVGGITIGRWVLGGLGRATLQGVTFTGVETGVIAAGTAATNFALVGAAWEAGVGVGSIISAAILPCEEEIEPPKPKGCK